MDTKHDSISFEEFVASVSDVFELVASGTPVTVERNGALFSLSVARNRAKHQGKPHGLTPTDPLLALIGIGASAEPTDIALHKHDYLAEAAADLHDDHGGTTERVQEHPRSQRQPQEGETEADRKRSQAL